MKEYNVIVSDSTVNEISNALINALGTGCRKVTELPLAIKKGRIIAVDGSAVHAYLPGATQGQLCYIKKEFYQQTLATEKTLGEKTLAEVTAVRGSEVILQPYCVSTGGISCEDFIEPIENALTLLAGDHLKGAIIDGLGRVILPSSDEAKYIAFAKKIPLFKDPPDALSRPIIKTPLSVGVRSIDTLLTLGQGQRIGIFAPAGVGKSTLLGMITRQAEADVVVLGLIGERGREVNEFLELVLDEQARKHCVVVVSTSDRPAIEKVKAIYTATSVAEYFRDQGKNVLLMVDSLTRFARAQRDVAIASGEHIPASGFPASVFSQLPLLLERAGQSDKGSITALYTVLVEDEKADDIIAEEVRSILDGHIILSRKLAASNHYPAIDVLASVSRVMPQITSHDQQIAAGKLRKLLSKYRELELLIRVGEYRKGEDAEADEAVQRYPNIIRFLQQTVENSTPMPEALQQLTSVSGAY